MIWYFVVLAALGLAYYLYFSPTCQLFGKVYFKKEGEKEKILALTFDDGPNEPYTTQLLEILKKCDVRATFFVVGQNAERYPEVIKKIDAEGHVIGSHSIHHSFFAPFLYPKFKKELIEPEKTFEKLIGKRPALFRPPWFHRNAFMLKTAKSMGLTTITGTFSSFWEVFQINSEKIAKDAIRNTKPGTILVFHDGYNNKTASRTKTLEAVEITIKTLLNKGYKFVTVPELLDIKPYQD